MESMKYIMRYNNYKNDSYSLGSPMNAICSRGDLLDPPEAGGCYDTKVMKGCFYGVLYVSKGSFCPVFTYTVIRKNFICFAQSFYAKIVYLY